MLWFANIKSSLFSSKNMSKVQFAFCVFRCEFSLIILQGIEPDSQMVRGHPAGHTLQHFNTLLNFSSDKRRTISINVNRN